MKCFLCLIIFLSSSVFANTIPIYLEHANSEETRAFGLMQQKSLPENQGMLFIYPEKQQVRIWMFNCFIDLSLAFLDENYIIRELHELKAYPEKMKDISVKNYKELMAFPKNSSIAQFFLQNSVQASFPASYALEMNKGWFTNHSVSIGDVLYLDEKEAYIKTKTL